MWDLLYIKFNRGSIVNSIVDEARDAFELYNLEQEGVLWVGSECGKYSLS